MYHRPTLDFLIQGKLDKGPRYSVESITILYFVGRKFIWHTGKTPVIADKKLGNIFFYARSNRLPFVLDTPSGL